MTDNGEKLIMHTEKMKAEDIVKKITEHAKVRMCLHTERESGEMPIEHTNVCVCVCVYVCISCIEQWCTHDILHICIKCMIIFVCVYMRVCVCVFFSIVKFGMNTQCNFCLSSTCRALRESIG